MIKNIWLLVFTSIFIIGCSSGEKTPTPEEKKIQEEIVQEKEGKVDLKEENELLKKELHKLKKGKKEIFESMFAAMVANNEDLVFKKALEIEKNYPETKEALIANKFKVRIINKYKNRLNSSMESISKKDNKPLQTVWYYDKKTKAKMSSSPIFVYISKKYDGQPVLRMRLQTTSESLNRLNGFVLYSESNSYDIVPPAMDIKQKQIIGGMWAWYDMEMGKKEISMMKDVIYAKKPLVRFLKGSKYEQLPLSGNDRRAIARVLRTYYQMKKVLKYETNL
ncbi:MAG: hypothetical protein OIF32_12760 [Campylobacterales bacterium]|nr:hypothetical protein [Campylobacterales bacterium]